MAPDEGKVLLAGKEFSSLAGPKRDRIRAEQIGVVFQQFNLLPFGSVLDNIALPLRFAPKRRARVPNASAEAKRLCSALGLPEDVLGQNAGSLSVGQQQRVAVARALIGSPPLLVADEPTSALDAATQTAFLDLLFSQAEEQGTSILMVSHDARLANQFDRVVNINDLLGIAA